jgi:hypothetical protein
MRILTRLGLRSQKRLEHGHQKKDNNLLFIDELSSRINLNFLVSNKLSKNLNGVGIEGIDSWVPYTPELRVNTLGFRSDEFTNVHEGKHILFSGCSSTFGLGLSEEEIWSSLLIKKMTSSGDKISGAFNLAKPGSGIFEIVSNIFKYCGKYGTPDSIFVQLPNLSRFYAFNRKTNQVVQADLIENKVESQFLPIAKGFKKQIEVNAYQYLMMLETFCKINNINLFIFGWYSEKYFSKNPELDNFIELSLDDMTNYVNNYLENGLDNQFAIVARDGQHQGTAQHSYWADLAFKIYKEKIG